MEKVCLLKLEFLQLYKESRLFAITEKNILLGFHKAGLYPFNPVAVLRILLSKFLEMPILIIHISIQTPKSKEQLETARELLHNEKINISNQHIMKEKVEKTTAVAFTNHIILSQENERLLTYNKQKEAKRAKK